MLESLNVNDNNWEDKVNWDVIANDVDFNKTKPLTSFFGITETDLNTKKDPRKVSNYINHITDRFERDFNNLPLKIKQTSKEYYGLFLQDPTLGKLRFHSLAPGLKGYVAINAGNHDGKTYRSVGKVIQDRKDPNIQHIKWFFIGGHAQYDDLTSRLRKK